jgi:hypothetical protein
VPTGHLVNGAFSLPSALRLGVRTLAPLGAGTLPPHTLSGPSSHDPLTFTLSTTTP